MNVFDSGLGIVLGALIAGAIVYIGYFIGSLKGQSRMGTWLSLLLGPLGWIIVLLMPDARFKCPECGGNVVPGKPRCCHCGADIAPKKTPIAKNDLMVDPAWNDPLAQADRARRKAPIPAAPRRVVTVKRAAQ